MVSLIMDCSDSYGCNSSTYYAVSGQIISLIPHSIPVCHLIHWVCNCGFVCGTADASEGGLVCSHRLCFAQYFSTVWASVWMCLVCLCEENTAVLVAPYQPTRGKRQKKERKEEPAALWCGAELLKTRGDLEAGLHSHTAIYEHELGSIT